MSENEKREVFVAEYRHEIVAKFAKQVIEGSLEIYIPPHLQSDDPDKKVEASKLKTKASVLISDIGEYFSGRLKGANLDQVEQRIFECLVYMRGITAIRQKAINRDQVLEEIDTLRARIDSTNNLLVQIATILKEVLKKFESK